MAAGKRRGRIITKQRETAQHEEDPGSRVAAQLPEGVTIGQDLSPTSCAGARHARKNTLIILVCIRDLSKTQNQPKTLVGGRGG